MKGCKERIKGRLDLKVKIKAEKTDTQQNFKMDTQWDDLSLRNRKSNWLGLREGSLGTEKQIEK